MSGSLYLVATPIGNTDDLTLRAKRILQEVDLIVCEEFKESGRLLRFIETEAELLRLNEHNEVHESDRIISFLQKGEQVALISDCGTPVLADPGLLLVQKAIANHITIVPVPGVASPLAALIVSGFPLHKWYYRGFLSPKKEQRKRELNELRNEELTTIIMETPYRLRSLLNDMLTVLGSERRIALCWQLTQTDEEIVRGSIDHVLSHVQSRDWQKGEFVVVLTGRDVVAKSRSS